MAVNIFPLLFISIVSFLNLFSYGYLPNIFCESFIIIQSIFIYLISLTYNLKYKLSNSLTQFLFVNLFFLLLSSIIHTSFFPISRGLGLCIDNFLFLIKYIKEHLFLFIKFLMFCFYFGVLLCLITENINISIYWFF